MSFANIFIFLHVFTMFLGVALSIGAGLVLQRVAATGNVAAIRTTFGAVASIGRAAPMVFGVGLLLGIIAAIVAQFNLLAPWLIIAYVLSAASSYLGAGVIGKWAASVGRAAATNQGEAPAPELRQLIGDRQVAQAMYANAAIIALIIFVMVFKPFS
jgi:hypothetical protein